MGIPKKSTVSRDDDIFMLIVHLKLENPTNFYISSMPNNFQINLNNADEIPSHKKIIKKNKNWFQCKWFICHSAGSNRTEKDEIRCAKYSGHDYRLTSYRAYINHSQFDIGLMNSYPCICRVCFGKFFWTFSKYPRYEFIKLLCTKDPLFRLYEFSLNYFQYFTILILFWHTFFCSLLFHLYKFQINTCQH